MLHVGVSVLSLLVAAFLLRGPASANDLPQTVLVLDQAGPGVLAYADMTAHLGSALNRKFKHVNIFTESLDLSRFSGSRSYQDLQSAFLGEKYRDIQVDAIVAFGARALEYALVLANKNWPTIPVVFGAVADGAVDAAELPQNVTGQTIRVSLHNSLTAARAMVPALRRIALVGDPLHRQAFRFHMVDELDQIRSSVEIIDLTGLPFSEVKKRVANLPDDSAIVYTTVNVDGAGETFLPTDALIQLAAVANRPIICDIERQVGIGAAGGFVVHTAQIGQQAGELAARTLQGESPSSIRVSQIDAVKPVFDWRQLQRWGVSDSNLPAGSDIRFRQLTLWEQYTWQVLLVGLALLVQAGLLLGLLYEDRRRRLAEANNQKLLGRIGYLNGIAGVDELTASIAHELRQPLAAIVASGAAGLNWLRGTTPNISEAKYSLHRIVNEVHRADDVMKNVRAMVRNEPPPCAIVNVNECIQKALSLIERRIKSEGVVLQFGLGDPPPIVLCNSVQLQQLFLNLFMNALEAMETLPAGQRKLSVSSGTRRDSEAVILIEDTGGGVAPDQIDTIFNAFVTTKTGGMGLGLAICKSIVETYGGRIVARARPDRGMTFEVALPLHGA